MSPQLLLLIQQPLVVARSKHEVEKNACSHNNCVHILRVQVNFAMEYSSPGGQNGKYVILVIVLPPLFKPRQEHILVALASLIHFRHYCLCVITLR